MDLNSLFPGVAQVPGMGFVQSARGGSLGDDASVMMISGLGQEPRGALQSKTSNVDASGKNIRQAVFSIPNLTSLLTAKVRVGEYEVPVWVLALAAAGVLGVAGWYFYLRPKK